MMNNINKKVWIRSLFVGMIFIGMLSRAMSVSAVIVSDEDNNPFSGNTPAIALCDQKIREAGIPVDGISGWPVERIDFKPGVTKEQKEKAWEIVHSFDYKKELTLVKNNKQTAKNILLSDSVEGVTEESFWEKLLSWGISFKDGIVHVVSLAVDNLSAKTAKIERLEMIDQATGQVYCTWIENSEWKKVQGSCDNFNAPTPTSPDASSTETSNSSAQDSVSPDASSQSPSSATQDSNMLEGAAQQEGSPLTSSSSDGVQDPAAPIGNDAPQESLESPSPEVSVSENSASQNNTP